jgi:hypothetical protein
MQPSQYEEEAPVPVPEVTFTATDQMADTLDAEGFTQRLDQLILGFRSSTMN